MDAGLNDIRKYGFTGHKNIPKNDSFRIMPYGESDNDWTQRAIAQRNYSGTLYDRTC